MRPNDRIVVNGEKGTNGFGFKFVAFSLVIFAVTAVCFLLGVAAGALFAGQAVLASADGGDVTIHSPLQINADATGAKILSLNATVPLYLRNRSLAPTNFSFGSVHYYMESPIQERDCLYAPKVRRQLQFEANNSNAPEGQNAIKGMTKTQFQNILTSPFARLDVEETDWPLSSGYDDAIIQKDPNKRKMPLELLHVGGKTQSQVEADPSGPPRFMFNGSDEIGRISLRSDSARITTLSIIINATINSEVEQQINSSCSTAGYVRIGALLTKPRSTSSAVTPWSMNRAAGVALRATWKISCS